MHVELELVEYIPGPQVLQLYDVATLSSWYLPPVHDTQAVLRSTVAWPFTQVLQPYTADSEASWYFP